MAYWHDWVHITLIDHAVCWPRPLPAEPGMAGSMSNNSKSPSFLIVKPRFSIEKPSFSTEKLDFLPKKTQFFNFMVENLCFSAQFLARETKFFDLVYRQKNRVWGFSAKTGVFDWKTMFLDENLSFSIKKLGLSPNNKVFWFIEY